MIDLKENISFLIDWSAMKKIIESDKNSDAKKLLEKLTEMNNSGKKISAVTTTAQFFGAVYRANSKTNINNLQKMLNVIEIRQSIDEIDFKSEESLRNEMLLIAKIISEKNNEKTL